MRVTVIGGHGRTGLELVKQLVAAKHDVVATIRNPEHEQALTELGAKARLVDLETAPADSIAEAFKGSDAVIFAAGSSEGQTSAFDRLGTLRTLRAAEKAGVKHYVSISAFGASTGLSTRSMSEEMKDYYRQKRSAAQHIVKSRLDWTIIEPAELTDDGASGQVRIALTAIKSVPIARADVAAVTIAALDDPKSVGKAIQVSGGKVPIEAALKRAVA